ncbi:serine protease [Cupriavidus necator]|uniref:S1 family peptidase n=1 Tax=Cupriavidus necator TaxID=106590 RepID=UPI003ECF641E
MSSPRKSKFVEQPADTPVSEIALRVLVEYEGGESYVIGTATLVAPFLALTAKHVLDEITSKYGMEDAEDGTKEISRYSVRLYQCLPGPRYVVFQVVTAWSCPDTDISVLHLAAFGSSDPAVPLNWRTPPLVFGAPPVGSTLAAFGYHSSIVTTRPTEGGSYHMDLDDKPTASSGVVEQILPQGQPSGNFTFPCYMMAARFDGGMSGGPVFDEGGALCGIISGSLSPGDDEEEPISYVCMLWPILPLLISVNRGAKYPQNVKYPIAHLVRDRQIHTCARSFNGIEPQFVLGLYSGPVMKP